MRVSTSDVQTGRNADVECLLTKGCISSWMYSATARYDNEHRGKLIFVLYMVILSYMVQISSDLRLNKLIFVPYMRFFACMVQICSALSWNKLISVPYMKFLTCMVQICSELRLNKLISVPYMKFFACMVQISSDLRLNKLTSVPYMNFLAHIVQPYPIIYEDLVLWGNYLLVWMWWIFVSAT